MKPARVLKGVASLVLGLLGLAGGLIVLVFGPQLFLAGFVNPLFLVAFGAILVVSVFAFRWSWKIAAALNKSALTNLSSKG